VDRGIPIVLRRANGQPLSTAAPPPSANDDFTSGCIRVMSAPWFGALPGLDDIVAKLFPSTPRAYWPFWFLGQYAQGKAHIDLGPHTCNVYFLRNGSKDVVIVPPEVTKVQPLEKGLDGLFITGSESADREYLPSLPYYYHLELQTQSVLVFNNTSCIHQFRNIQAADGSWPQALSLRVKHVAASEPRIWWHLLSDVKMSWRFTGVFLDQILLNKRSEDRDAKYL